MLERLACFARVAVRKVVCASPAKARKASALAPIALLLLSGLPSSIPVFATGRTTPFPAVVQSSTAGALDSSFGSGGSVLTAFNLPSVADSMALQADGKILAAGFSFESSSGPTTIPGSELARYNSDGSLDSSFGSNGVVNFLEPPGFAIFAVAIQTNGQILVAGAQLLDISLASARPQIVRVNSNGTMDTTFGDFGVVTNGSGAALSIALQPNGQIVTAGLVNSGVSQVFGLTRYNADGSLDAGFGAGGEVTLPLSVAFSVAVQSDGAIVAGGVTGISSTSPITGFPNILSGGQFALVRVNSDGSPDTTFGNGGTVQTNLQTASAISQVVLQSDGRILAEGTSESSSGQLDFALVRYNSDGTMDGSFGNGGVAINNFDGNDDVAFGIALQADGQIVVAGSSFTAANQPGSSGLFFFPLSSLSGSSIAVARYNSNGTLDANFGTGGAVITPLQQGAGAFSVLIPQDGKIAVAGATSPAAGTIEFALAQYDAGTLAGDFLLTPGAQSLTVADGSSATVNIGVQTAAGSTPPSGQVSLSATVLPTGSGVTASFSSPAVSPGGSSTLTLSTTGATATGSYVVQVTGVAGSITHTVTLTLAVTGQDFSLSLSAPTITTATSLNVFPRVVITHIGGFDGKVTVTAPRTNLPAGIQFFGGANKTRRKNLVVKYRYKVTNTAAAGTYFLTFTATDQAGRVRSVTLTLIVTGPAPS